MLTITLASISVILLFWIWIGGRLLSRCRADLAESRTKLDQTRAYLEQAVRNWQMAASANTLYGELMSMAALRTPPETLQELVRNLGSGKIKPKVGDKELACYLNPIRFEKLSLGIGYIQDDIYTVQGVNVVVTSLMPERGCIYGPISDSFHRRFRIGT